MAKRTVLFYNDGRSDKIYTVILEPKGDGFIVRAEYGRRGGPQQNASKTASPVTLQAAEAIFASAVREKVAKGYWTGGDAPEHVVATAEADVLGFLLPQLLNPIEEDQVTDLILSSEWWAQEKHDGVRFQLVKDGTKIYGYSRTGRSAQILSKEVVAAALDCAWTDFILDGELVGNAFIAFDLLRAEGHDLRGLPYEKRLESLRMPEWKRGIGVAETATGITEKADLLFTTRTTLGEGVVFKKKSSLYVPGRPNVGGDWLKFKFIASGSFIVAEANAGGKSAIAVKLADGTPVGRCTIPPNHAMPEAGAIVEISYLYFVGSLVQPVYCGQRDDIPESDCVASQLKHKAAVAA